MKPISPISRADLWLYFWNNPQWGGKNPPPQHQENFSEILQKALDKQEGK